MTTFTESNLSPELLRALTELGFSTPSPIQAQALPILLGPATDFIGLAATGTGKTAAFAIPLLQRIQPDVKSVQALILCPTRELALQVSGQIDLLGKYLGIRSVPVYGGAGYGDQIRGLREGGQIVVGTPGRVIDHLEKGTLVLTALDLVILDEADEMISMGFKDDLEQILKSVPADHSSNTWLFSATMSPEVRRVADTYLKKPQQVQVNRKEMLSTTVQQIYFPVRESDKAEILCKIIEASDHFYGLVFCQTKALVMDLAQYMLGRGYRVETLHGDKTQADRERTLKSFREKRSTVMICTDVASRGLDVKDVTHVVNYSLPRELDVYVHRIGRTARSGKEGIAISLVTVSHRGILGRIEALTKTRMVEGKIPTRRDIGIKKLSVHLGKFNEQPNAAKAQELLSDEWKAQLETLSKEEIAGRFLAMLSPEVFNVVERARNEEPRFDRTPREPSRREGGSESRGSRSSYGSARSGGGAGRDRYRASRGDSSPRRYERSPDSERGGDRDSERSSMDRPNYRSAERGAERATDRGSFQSRSSDRGGERGERSGVKEFRPRWERGSSSDTSSGPSSRSRYPRESGTAVPRPLAGAGPRIRDRVRTGKPSSSAGGAPYRSRRAESSGE